MKLAVLLSGGKDSLYSCWKAMQTDEVVCFITIRSLNCESYMFHTPNINVTRLQAQAAGIPIIEWETAGQKESELEDLQEAIHYAAETYGVQGIVTGAIQSVYQAARVQRICSHLKLWSFNPLWLCDQKQYMYDLINAGFECIIAGVFSAPFTETWLGKPIDRDFINHILAIRSRYGISLTGEGGEYESFVCNAPFFSKKIEIYSAKADYHNHNGRYIIIDAGLVE